MKKAKTGPDIEGLFSALQQQLDGMEKKIDALMSRPSQRPPEPRPFQKPFQQSPGSQARGPGGQVNTYRDRVMYKAVCADCKKDCEVPFKPSGERPVYCKECFTKHKGTSPFRPRPDTRHGETHPTHHAAHVDAPQGAERKKPAEKKKFYERFRDKKRPAAKKRGKRK